MKKNVIVAVTASVILLCVLAVIFVTFIAFRIQARDIALYLPPAPVAEGISVTTTNSKVFNRFATRQFLFTAVDTATASKAAERLEAQLLSAGWEKTSVCLGDTVFSSSWRHRGKLNGKLQLAFTTLKLVSTANTWARW